MANDLVVDNASREMVALDTQQYVTVFIRNQMFGIPVLQVHDILANQKITRIPLAPQEVAGSLNLRGRIVTAIDVRRRLRLPPRDDGKNSMSVVVEVDGEPYSLIVDSVGEVLSLSDAKLEKNPSTLDPLWREVSAGIFRLDNRLMVVLDTTRLLTFDS
ncbi:MAG: chemotaxis protein CheW [Alphaproteobacteria bacterium]|nr:chemotaxis protein CheW [Alphaproteobacteria bacterium]